MYSTVCVLSLHKMNMLVLWHYQDQGDGSGRGMLNRREEGGKKVYIKEKSRE